MSIVPHECLLAREIFRGSLRYEVVRPHEG